MERWKDLAKDAAALSPDEFLRVVERADHALRPDLLRARFRYDRGTFARFIWEDRFDLPWNPCHLALLADAPEAFPDRPTYRSAVAAPRGIGKSSIASFIEPLHGIAYGLESFIVIVSAEDGLAVELTEDLKAELDDPDNDLAALFGPFEVTGTKSDFVVRGPMTPKQGIRVVAKSFGGQLRGAKYRGQRPSLYILDDAERSDRVANPKQRAKWWSTLTKDILKGGRRRGGTRFLVRGTILHADSMLANLMDHPGWVSSRWASMIEWPERMDLWETCGRLWKDLTDPDRAGSARQFYEANREDMDDEAEVLDPIGEPLFELFEIIWGEGLVSFLYEKNNDPRSSNDRYFVSEGFTRCRIVGDTVEAADGRRIKFSDLRVCLHLDPIPGKELRGLGDDGGAGAGDFGAVAVIGRDKFGYGYLLDLWMKRGRDTDQLDAMWFLAERYGAKRASIESNGFQRLFGRAFRRMREERKAAGEFYQVSIDEDVSRLNKEDRIASLEPATTNGWLQFSDRIPPAVFGQFDDFPDADHDDGPDAIEGAWRLSGGTPPSMNKTNRII